jgi:Ion channel
MLKREDENLCHLPKKRTGLRVELLASWSMWRIALTGLLLYVALVTASSLIGYCFSRSGESWVKAADGAPVHWWDIVYFNFISALSIGYGDYIPAGDGARLTAVVEALLGTGILGITLAAITAKFLSPPQNAIAFSRYAYYCTENQSFLVIFLNTSRSRLVNAEISSYFKLGRDWTVRPAAKSPFVTRAVQTFLTDFVNEEDLVQYLDEEVDVLRFSLSGLLGGTLLSVAIQYSVADIIVLPNRDVLTTYPGFWNVDLRSPELEAMFHYHPAGAPTLSEYINMRRRQQEANAQ